ncbi:MAG: potassium transporter KtrB [Clostridia bacterium]|nr:potassium transporter KtrB [Clostridia bacterium]
MKKKKDLLSTTQIIMLSFLGAIFLGTLLLMLPISTKSNESAPFIDALFTATTSTCVTGLVTVPTFSYWSTFGHIVILLLIQIGGLGVITVLAGIAIKLNKKMSIGNRVLLQDAFNLNSLSGLVKFVKKVIKGTFIVEGAGALLYMTVFVPEFGAVGIWYSVFNSVSAFCNAGIDIISADSLAPYVFNPIINFVTIALIVLGGMGYIVWWDVINAIKNRIKHNTKILFSLSLHSRIVIFYTLILIFGGALCIFIFEYNNPLTMKDYNLYERVVASLFQSVTTRTSGFYTIPQENLSSASSILSVLLMFIGGSPVGTAGGIKTVTFVILIASAISAIKSKDEVNILHRTIKKEAVSKALAVTLMSFSVFFISSLLLSFTSSADVMNVIYETASATATVGLTRNFTGTLDDIGKLIIIVTMYLGRVGPISLAVAFKVKKDKQYKIKNPTEEVSVG